MNQISIMGILNITPDSYHDGGLYFNTEKAIKKAIQLAGEGADIIDIGGESTRPNQSFNTQNGLLCHVSASEELERIYPVVYYLRNEFPSLKISIDTRRIEVAKEIIKLSPYMINYITEKPDPEFLKLLVGLKTKICICHMHGTPETMQQGPFIEGNIVQYLHKWMQEQIELAKSLGITKEQLVLDPGICFGKENPKQNLEILSQIKSFKIFDIPILIGLSRKSFLGKLTNKPGSELISATIAANSYCMMNGVNIIRVHDVIEHVDAKKVCEALQKI